MKSSDGFDCISLTSCRILFTAGFFKLYLSSAIGFQIWFRSVHVHRPIRTLYANEQTKVFVRMPIAKRNWEAKILFRELKIIFFIFLFFELVTWHVIWCEFANVAVSYWILFWMVLFRYWWVFFFFVLIRLVGLFRKPCSCFCNCWSR